MSRIADLEEGDKYMTKSLKQACYEMHDVSVMEPPNL
jgi:hypothetical protein